MRHVVATLLEKRSPAEMISALKTLQRPQRSKALEREIKAFIQQLGSHLEAQRKPEAMATALAILFADAEYAVAKMRRDGVLRASKYGFRGLLIANVARAALDIRPLLIARDERFEYLKSVVALTKLAPSALALHDKIVKILRRREDVALKTVLAVLNSRFYHHNPPDVSLSSLKMDRYTVEDVSDGASLILSIYREIFPIHDNCCNHVDIEGIMGATPVYERLFLAAIRLTKFKDAEVLIDGLPFQARMDVGGVHISSVDPDIEKSIRLGYIQGQNQVAIRARHLRDSNPPLSMREVIEKGFERGALDRLVELVDKPVRRFRLFLPTAPQVFQMFRTNEMLRDDIESLLMIDADIFGELDPNLQITPYVTAMDLLKVQRYFNFISCLYQKKIETIEDAEDRAYLTFSSTIPVVPHDQLFGQLQLIFDDATKSREIIRLLVIDYGSSHIDLQYTPLIDLGTYYVIAPHVLAASNLVRNVTVAKKLREFALGSADPMIRAVVKALASAGFQVRSDFALKVNGKDIELDIVAWRDSALFLFECKNAYHPCSAHEMRNSFDHIQKAQDQLDVRRDLFRDPRNQATLFGKLGWKVPPTAELYTGIVIANRIFHGVQFNGHPVRQAHELINVLQNGTLGGDGHDLRFWTSDGFTTCDLVTYLAGDSLATKQLSALEPYSVEIDLGAKRLVFDSYALDPQKLIDVMVASYRGA